MIRILASLTALVLALPAYPAACGAFMSWDQKWFPSDATHYIAADLDGDNIPEIVSASTTTVTYRKAPGLTPFQIYTGTAIGAPVAGDVTGDGKIDLVIPDDANNALVVLPGNGNATFGSAATTPLAVSAVRLVLGNFSGNAQLDVALIGSGASLIFLQGNGTGAFTQVGTVSIASAPHHLAVANFDSDGYDDVAISHTSSTTNEVVFANGSGGSAATVTLNSGNSAMLAADDFDGDGDKELYSVTSDRIYVFPNNGSRTFGTPPSDFVFYEVVTPRSLALADFDGDGNRDLIVGRPGYFHFVMRTSAASSGWTFANGTQFFPLDETNNAHSIAAGDFNGDGNVDVAVENAAGGRGGFIRNACGNLLLSAGMGEPKITLGQVARGNAKVYASTFPKPTGTVKLTWNGGETTVTLLPTGSINTSLSQADFEVDGLPLGFHSVVADYSGDTNYPTTTSTTWIEVTDEFTTTTLEGPSEWTYGEPQTFHAAVTSSTGDTPTGSIFFTIDGATFRTGVAPEADWPIYFPPAGSHTFGASFGGSLTYPPSKDSIDVTIHKASSEVQLRSGTISRVGATASVDVAVRALNDAPAGGNVRLVNGTTTLDTEALNPQTPGSQSLTLRFANNLPPGEYTFHIVYDGNDNVEGTSLAFVHTVLPADTAFPLVAMGADSSVKLEALPPSGGIKSVYRRSAASGWTQVSPISIQPTNSSIDFSVVAGTTYQYQMQWTNNGVTTLSNIETVYVGPFTDTNLAGALIKKTHFTEVQSALNGFRTMAGLSQSQINFTGFILASHLTQMRTAINDARSALGMPVITFGASPVAGVTPIRAADLLQLREALR